MITLLLTTVALLIVTGLIGTTVFGSGTKEAITIQQGTLLAFGYYLYSYTGYSDLSAVLVALSPILFSIPFVVYILYLQWSEDEDEWNPNSLTLTDPSDELLDAVDELEQWELNECRKAADSESEFREIIKDFK